MNDFPPSGRNAGRLILLVARGLDPVGIGRQIELAADAFRAAGWKTHLAVMSAGGAVPPRLAAAGVAVHRLGQRPTVDAAAMMRLAELVRGLRLGDGDTILSWGLSQAPVAAAMRTLAPATRLVCHVARRPHGLGLSLALTRADMVLASSAEVADATARLGVAPTRLRTVAPAAVAAEATGLSRVALGTRLGIDPAKTWTLCTAPLESPARLERLLWAIDQLGVVHRRLEHVLVGNGPLRRAVAKRARGQHLAERLHVFPTLECLPDLMREVRLVWQSGDVACGGAILDGLALGIPAVAVDSEAARQLVVDGETGRIVASEPEGEFPRCALPIIEDDALAARYGAAARKRAAAEFPLEPMGAAFVAAAG